MKITLQTSKLPAWNRVYINNLYSHHGQWQW